MARVRLSTKAEKAYEKLARSDRRLFARVDRALDLLSQQPYAGKALHGPLSGRRSLRVGPARIIYRYQSEKLVVLVLAITPRDKAYR